MNQREIGELMGIDYSAVSAMRKRLSVGWERGQMFILEFAIVVSSIKKSALFRRAYSACCGGQAWRGVHRSRLTVKH